MARNRNKAKNVNIVAKDSVHVINLSSYTSPQVVENPRKEYIEYGDDNQYFQYLIDRYNGSATNNAAINGISEMIYGRGLDASDSKEKPEAYEQMRTLFSKECMKKVCYDYKMMGHAAVKVIYTKDRTKVIEVEHIPIETLRAEKATDGKVMAYYYHPKWKDIKKDDEPKRISAFGMSKDGIEILYIRPYKAGFYYYSPVDYQGGLQYAELEEEIGNYHINNIQNGLQPSMLINFNNGTPNKEQRDEIERAIYEKFSGSSNAGKFILAFNDSKELAATIEPVMIPDAYQQYEFLANESMTKVMVSHRIVSPMLVGIKDQTGLGNNAQELETASILMDNTVIRPMQVTIIDELQKILEYNNIDLDLYFKTLQPLEFTDLTNAISDAEVEKETGVKKDDIEREEEINEQSEE